MSRKRMHKHIRKKRLGIPFYYQFVISTSHHENKVANQSIIIPEGLDFKHEANYVTSQLETFKPKLFDCIICTAGGWGFDKFKSKSNFHLNSDFINNIDSMFNKNLFPAFSCLNLAATFLAEFIFYL